MTALNIATFFGHVTLLDKGLQILIAPFPQILKKSKTLKHCSVMLLFPVKASTVSFHLLNLDWSIQISGQLNVRKVIIKKNITKRYMILYWGCWLKKKNFFWGGEAIIHLVCNSKSVWSTYEGYLWVINDGINSLTLSLLLTTPRGIDGLI